VADAPYFDNLEEYPLAKRYGWRAPKRDTGGILFIYPPRTAKLMHSRVFAINPDDLHAFRLDKHGDPITHPKPRGKDSR
jgi:hypothetical protein